MQIINAHRRYDSWCLPRDPWNADALLSFAEDLLYTPSPTHLVATLLKTAADRDTINLCTRVLQVNCTLSRPLDYSRSTQYISCHPYPSIVHYCLSRWGGGRPWKMDWNFEIVKHIKNKGGSRQIYAACFMVMDEYNDILMNTFTHTKSWVEVKPLLLALQNRWGKLCI
jgi:hypothetical protein